MTNTFPRFAFFGTPTLGVQALEALLLHGMLPSVIITNPDAPQGRKMILTPPPVKVWAEAHGIPVLQPQSLRTDNTVERYLSEHALQLAVVVAYGKMIPQSLLSLPQYGFVNMHPSLLPRLRGASPIRSAILHDEKQVGVSIMLLDDELDHGPILSQKEVTIDSSVWPMRGNDLDALLGTAGAELLSDTLGAWIDGSLTPVAQNHAAATFSVKITKDMGELDLHDDPYQNLLKIRAFDGWPGTYFFHEHRDKRIRVKIIDAELVHDGSLMITRVVPEGKNEMDYSAFIAGY